jgi:hypothetical protein
MRWFFADQKFTRLALLQQAGNEPALTALLRVYKNYCPEIIVGFAGSGRSLSLKVGIFKFSWPSYSHLCSNLTQNGERDY